MTVEVDNDEFWERLRKDYEDICLVTRDYWFPDQNEIEHYQLSLLLGDEIEFPKHKYYVVLSNNKLKEHLSDLIILGIDIPDHLQQDSRYKFMVPRDIPNQIEQAIKDREFSYELMENWVSFNVAYRQFCALIADDKIDLYQKRNIDKNIPHLVSRYLLAQAMKPFLESGLSKSEAIDKSQDILFNAIEEKSGDWPEWKTEAIVSLFEEGENIFKSNYQNITGDDIERMARNTKNRSYPFDL